ncbi:MAG: c-type cytochrome [Burkholderiales bacterium]|nr:c-type cytochrome [Burkholderiales bacterium]
MCRSDVAAAVALALACTLSHAGPGTGKAPTWPGIGRPATPAEIRAWDIDVRPDFKGLPRGQGSVARGQDIWESKCASCHGVFGESNEVFTPIVGGTTRKDVQTGRVEALAKGTEAQRTTMMKLSTLSTLWDYIHRAMPWNNPRTLGVDDTYAVTAYILNLAEILPGDFVLSDRNIREVQALLPNRDGKSPRHGLWLPTGKPDVRNVACMRNCAPDVKIASSLPDHARGSHGNLADQDRNRGGLRGQVTAASATAAARGGEFAAVKELTGKAACLGCHGVDRKIVGPGFNQVSEKYRAKDNAEAYLAGKIKAGGQGIWGQVPMPPSVTISDADAALLARWILKGTPE